MESLLDVLVRNQGAVLTPELITGIIHTTAKLPDKSIASKLGPCVDAHGDVTFQIERLPALLPELKAHHRAQWEEVERVRDNLNPNYEHMVNSERDGRYVLFTARKNGQLVGNTSCYVYESLHTRELAAKEDTMYVIPEARKGLMAVKFFKYCEAQLLKLGVKEITVSVKTSNNVYKLWERQGYEFSDRVLSKTFYGD